MRNERCKGHDVGLKKETTIEDDWRSSLDKVWRVCHMQGRKCVWSSDRKMKKERMAKDVLLIADSTDLDGGWRLSLVEGRWKMHA